MTVPVEEDGPFRRLRGLPAPLGAVIDQGAEALFRIAGRLPAFDPLALGLASRRRARVDALVAEVLPRLRPLVDGVLACEPEACSRYDALVAATMADLRGTTGRGAAGALFAADRRLYRDEAEWLDDPAIDREERIRLLAVLDRFNEQLGNYRAWGDTVAALVDRTRRQGPVQVCDLAAGHGGFALALQRRLGARVAVTATDVMDEYLDLGRAQAAAAGLPVRFLRQDATDLRDLRAPDGGGFDILLCTQSLHHFPPGMVARLIGQAARAAGRALCFIDAERNVLGVLLLGHLLGAYGRSQVVYHDTVTSLRRMYLAEELELCCRLAPGVPADFALRVERRSPGYAYLFGERA